MDGHLSVRIYRSLIPVIDKFKALFVVSVLLLIELLWSSGDFDDSEREILAELGSEDRKRNSLLLPSVDCKAQESRRITLLPERRPYPCAKFFN